MADKDKTFFHPHHFAGLGVASIENDDDVSDDSDSSIAFNDFHPKDGSEYELIVEVPHIDDVTSDKTTTPKVHFNDELVSDASFIPTVVKASDSSSDVEVLKAALLSDELYLQVKDGLKCDGSVFFKIIDGILFANDKIYVPESLRAELLARKHDIQVAGHMGIAKTIDLIARNFWWKSLRIDVKDYVSTCEGCLRNKVSRQKPAGLLMPLSIPDRPWSGISVDFVVKLPVSDGFDSVCIVKDRFSKMAHFLPVNETITAVQLAGLFVKQIFRLHGLPDDIVSDRGAVFTSKFWGAICKSLQIRRSLTTAFHPQSNGGNERVNTDVYAYLRQYTNYLQTDWVQFLPTAEFAYNNSIHSATGMTPFFANYGYHPRMDVDFHVKSAVPAASSFLNRLQQVWKAIMDNILASQARMIRFANGKRKPVAYKLGDMVWLNRRNLTTRRPSQKLDSVRIGPFEITKVINRNSVQLKLPPRSRIHNVFHVDLLRPYTKGRFYDARKLVPPPPIVIDNEEEYVVDKILDSRYFGKTLKYLVRWKNYPPESDSWEPSTEVLRNARESVNRFHKNFPSNIS